MLGRNNMELFPRSSFSLVFRRSESGLRTSLCWFSDFSGSKTQEIKNCNRANFALVPFSCRLYFSIGPGRIYCTRKLYHWREMRRLSNQNDKTYISSSASSNFTLIEQEIISIVKLHHCAGLAGHPFPSPSGGIPRRTQARKDMLTSTHLPREPSDVQTTSTGSSPDVCELAQGSPERDDRKHGAL